MEDPAAFQIKMKGEKRTNKREGKNSKGEKKTPKGKVNRKML